MSSYIDLLKTQEWENKRRVILEKNNHTCQRCGFNSKSENLPRGINVSFDTNTSRNFSFDFFKSKINDYNHNYIAICNKDNKNIICKTSVDRERFIKNIDQYIMIVQLGMKSKIVYDIVATTEPSTSNYNNLFIYCNERAIEKMKDKIGDDYEVDKEGFWLVEKEKRYEYTKNRVLQVHHKCYIKNIKVWSQIDNEYIALCNICHRIVHENQKIPFYTSDNNSYWLEPCDRCGGTRYIEAYKHVSNGICFKCNGDGFDNYIQ